MDQLQLQQAVNRAVQEDIPVRSMQAVHGGSINDCRLLQLVDGRRLFVKTHSGAMLPGMYAAEALALELLAEPGTLDVPRPLLAEDELLVLEAFEAGEPAVDWQEQMGRGLAGLHRATVSGRFGFDVSTYLGTTLQDNTWQDDWVTFWREQRLGHQLGLYRRQAGPADPLLTAGDTLLSRLDDLLAVDNEPPVLLHGDLWAGNAAANEKGSPIIFDPAAYYGQREAEIGMMRLFGGFGPRCEAAYQEVWPFAAGADERIEVYRLYHQLNHLNLFGGGYYDGCLSTIRKLL